MHPACNALHGRRTTFNIRKYKRPLNGRRPKTSVVDYAFSKACPEAKLANSGKTSLYATVGRHGDSCMPVKSKLDNAISQRPGAADIRRWG